MICVHHTRESHFWFGVTGKNGWIQQTPSFAGYAAVWTYLPGNDIAVATTRRPDHRGGQLDGDRGRPDRRSARRLNGDPVGSFRTNNGS